MMICTTTYNELQVGLGSAIAQAVRQWLLFTQAQVTPHEIPKMTLKQVLFQVLWFSPVNYSTTGPYSSITAHRGV